MRTQGLPVILLLLAPLPPLCCGCGDGSGAPGEKECGTGSPEALMACVDRERYVTDLDFIAAERDNGSPHWQAVQDLCAGRLAEMGYEVELHGYGTGVNVIGLMRGGLQPEQQVVISAHYDHIEDCEGADDNATGVAALLEAARVLAPARFSRTLLLAFWDEEEDGMVGSEAYVSRAASQGQAIIVAYVLDMIGYKSSEPGSQKVPAGLDLLFKDQMAWLKQNEFRADFIALLPDELAREPAEHLAQYAGHVGLPAVLLEIKSEWKMSPLLEDLRRSDHVSFWSFDYPAIAISDSAEYRNPHYHCEGGRDSVETLDHDFAIQVLQALLGSAAMTLEIL